LHLARQSGETTRSDPVTKRQRKRSTTPRERAQTSRFQ
jgi:hypothetical protein